MANRSAPHAASPRGAPGLAQQGIRLLLMATLPVFGLGSPVGDGPNAQSRGSAPVINIAGVIHVEPAAETAFPIPIGPIEAVPRQAFVRIRGLPRTVSLSEGHEISPGAWAIPLSALSALKISSPLGSDGKAEITVSLLTLDGQVLSEVTSTLLITPAALLSAGPPRQRAAPQASAALTTAPIQQQLAPTGPQLKPEDRERASGFVRKGDENIAAGNITVARLFYQRAAEIGLAQGALSLAMTFDPDELVRWKVVGGVQPDRDQARKWYERARELGAPEAATRLHRLTAR